MSDDKVDLDAQHHYQHQFMNNANNNGNIAPHLYNQMKPDLANFFQNNYSPNYGLPLMLNPLYAYNNPIANHIENNPMFSNYSRSHQDLLNMMVNNNNNNNPEAYTNNLMFNHNNPINQMQHNLMNQSVQSEPCYSSEKRLRTPRRSSVKQSQDPKYRQRRDKNNEAAKKCREKKRQENDQVRRDKENLDNLFKKLCEASKLAEDKTIRLTNQLNNLKQQYNELTQIQQSLHRNF